MKITVLVENRSACELPPKHGLSLYIETEKHKILFDVGPGNTLFENSRKRGIDLSKVDTVIISHGHSDHGGALEQFLRINHTAKIYAQRKAFEKHYLKIFFLRISVGILSALQTHPQVVLLDGDYAIDSELALFTVPNTEKCYSNANDALYMENGANGSHAQTPRIRKDDFSHEHNLMILGDRNVLIMGCGHAGVVNILEKAAIYKPQICVGGYHLWNPINKKSASNKLLEDIAKELEKYSIHYYTCHCTGQKEFNYLSERLPDMSYMSCGESAEI